MPRASLVSGLARLLRTIYEPTAYFDRAHRSILRLTFHGQGHCAHRGPRYSLQVLASSIWLLGIISPHRAAYWRFLWRITPSLITDARKRAIAVAALLSADHFFIYAEQAAVQLDELLESELSRL